MVGETYGDLCCRRSARRCCPCWPREGGNDAIVGAGGLLADGSNLGDLGGAKHILLDASLLPRMMAMWPSRSLVNNHIVVAIDDVTGNFVMYDNMAPPFSEHRYPWPSC